MEQPRTNDKMTIPDWQKLQNPRNKAQKRCINHFIDWNNPKPEQFRQVLTCTLADIPGYGNPFPSYPFPPNPVNEYFRFNQQYSEQIPPEVDFRHRQKLVKQAFDNLDVRERARRSEEYKDARIRRQAIKTRTQTFPQYEVWKRIKRFHLTQRRERARFMTKLSQEFPDALEWKFLRLMKSTPRKTAKDTATKTTKNTKASRRPSPGKRKRKPSTTMSSAKAKKRTMQKAAGSAKNGMMPQEAEPMYAFAGAAQ